jgi:hypothetical protein
MCERVRGGRAVYSGTTRNVDNWNDHIVIFLIFPHIPGRNFRKYTARPPASPSAFWAEIAAVYGKES